MTLVYFLCLMAAVVLGYLGYAAVNAYVLSKPTWPFRKVK